MLEILAPAGNKDCALAGINNGANAIYLGYCAFSARQGADNFTGEGLSEIISHAHFTGVKVYVAMNTIVKDSEKEEFIRTLVSVWNMGADAIILQDALLGKAIKDAYPEIQLHLSTQAGVCNENGAKFAKDCGFSRVILARETPLAEIEKITKIIETEVFVQGALCTCFSGQCYFSSFIGGNSGNRGRCKQPCRKKYSYTRNGYEEKAYALSLSDLSVGEDIQKYISAGVVSFKIEGRMRRAEYVASATRYYRQIIDKTGNLVQGLSALKRTYNRGNYTKGLAFGQDKRLLSTAIQGHIGEKVGVVKVVAGKYIVESSQNFTNGDAFKILRDGKEVGGAFFSKKENKGFSLSSKERLKNGDSVFITTDSLLNKKLLDGQKKGEISLALRFAVGENAVAKTDGVEVVSETVLQSANSSPLTKEQVVDCFTKTDGLPISVAFDKVEIIGDIFIPKSQLNAFRREFYAQLTAKIKNERYLQDTGVIKAEPLTGKNTKIAVISSAFSGIKTDIAIYKPNDYFEIDADFIGGNYEKYLYYPAFTTSADEEKIKEVCKDYNLDGVYTDSSAGLVFAKENNLKAFAGTGLNLINGVAISELLKREEVAYFTVSKEADESIVKSFAHKKAFVLGAGAIKLMDLCYCPFEKTCKNCDNKSVYTLMDENGRAFPVRRYQSADNSCRFEVYNCADLIAEPIDGVGILSDLTVVDNKFAVIDSLFDTEKQKKIFTNYTSGHRKKGVL